MTLNKELVDDPANWRLSMLLEPDAIEVFAHRLVGEAPVVAARLPLSATAPQAEAFEEAVYANPLLLMPFQKTDLLISTADALIAPPDVEEEPLRQLLGFENDKSLIFSEIDDRNSVAFLAPRGVANFVGRTFDKLQPRHVLSVLARYSLVRSQRGNTAKAYVCLGKKSLSLLVLNNLGLVMARHFDDVGIDEAAYWILAVFRHCGLDPQADEIFIAGDGDRRHQLTPRLSKFVNYVMPAIFPSAAYHGDAQAMKAAFPLTILPLCE